MMRIFLSSPLDDPALVRRVCQSAVMTPDKAEMSGHAGRIVETDAAGAASLAFHAAVYGADAEPRDMSDGVDMAILGAGLDGGDFWTDLRREAAPEIMDRLGIETAGDLARRLPQILSRAQARLAADRAPGRPESGLDRDDIEIISHQRPYNDFFTVEEYHLRHTRFDGTRSEILKRAVFVAADAVTVLPYDPVRDRVLLVEQMRAGPLGRGDPSPWILEPIAGRIEPGDTPERTAHKEAAEEAGLTITALHPIAGYYASTGAFSEYVHSFVGIANLPDAAAGLGGVAGEGEDIKGHLMTRERFMARVRRGDMPDAPLLVSAYWLEVNLARVRAGADGFG